MKTKIFILLAVLLSLSGIQELRSQDTLWTKTFKESIDASLTIDGTKVLYTFWPGPTQQLCTADSGRVIWTTDSLHLFRGLMSPDSTTFLSYGITDSNTEYLTIRRLSDGAVIKRYDTIISNNYPKPIPLKWAFQYCLFSNDGRYLYCTTSDFVSLNITTHNIIFKIDLINDVLVFVRQDSSLWMEFMKPNENYLIFSNKNGLSFYTLDSLKEYKYYKDRGISKISRSGRYITTMHGEDSLLTWDTQIDSIIKRNHLDSLKLWDLRYTQNDSIVIISALPIDLWQWKLIFYNVLSGRKIKEMLMHYTLNGVLLTPASFEVSPDGSKLLVNGTEGIYMFPLSLNPITHKEDNPPEAIIRVNPNPALGNVAIEFDSQTYYDAKISLYDENGGFVMNIKEGNLNSGMNTITFSTKNLSNGIYFIRVAGRNINQSTKLIIMK